jgi:probable HAF family extracellular repeat protein
MHQPSVAVVLGLCLGISPCAAQPRVIELGTLGGAQAWANDMSADGLVVVGNSSNASGQLSAFRWTESSGMVDLGAVGTGGIDARCTNSDGTVIVGSFADGAVSRGFRWTVTGGFTEFSIGIPVRGMSIAGLSDDGRTIVGHALPTGASNNILFVWREGLGVQILPSPPGGTAQFEGVSGDGSVPFGVFSPASSGSSHAIRWTASGTELLSDGARFWPRHSNSDGTRFVGEVQHGSDEAAIWRAGSGLQLLGRFDCSDTAAHTANESGLVVGGGSEGGDALIWTPQRGWRTLRTVFQESGGTYYEWNFGRIIHASDSWSTVVVEGSSNGTGSSRTVVVTGLLPLCPLPTIVAAPVPATACVGDGVAIALTAGEPGQVTYRWRRDGIAIDPSENPTATSSTLYLNSVAMEHGGTYDCEVANACGSVVSAPAELVVQACCTSDINGDGGIDADDVIAFFERWDSGC